MKKKIELRRNEVQHRRKKKATTIKKIKLSKATLEIKHKQFNS